MDVQFLLIDILAKEKLQENRKAFFLSCYFYYKGQIKIEIAFPLSFCLGVYESLVLHEAMNEKTQTITVYI